MGHRLFGKSHRRLRSGIGEEPGGQIFKKSVGLRGPGKQLAEFRVFHYDPDRMKERYIAAGQRLDAEALT